MRQQLAGKDTEIAECIKVHVGTSAVRCRASGTKRKDTGARTEHRPMDLDKEFLRLISCAFPFPLSVNIIIQITLRLFPNSPPSLSTAYFPTPSWTRLRIFPHSATAHIQHSSIQHHFLSVFYLWGVVGELRATHTDNKKCFIPSLAASLWLRRKYTCTQILFSEPSLYECSFSNSFCKQIVQATPFV